MIHLPIKYAPMKKILYLASFLFFGFSAEAQPTPVSNSISAKISQRAKDSLGLTEGQRVRLFQLNQLIDSSKQEVWKKYDSPDSLKIHLQQIENTRDSLYRPVFSEAQYHLYLKKKKYLITNN